MNKSKILLKQFFSDEFPYPAEAYQQTMPDKPETTPTTPRTNISNKEAPAMTLCPPPTDPELLEIYQECHACKACELCSSATNLVFGDGNPNADLMIIGEAPGADEDIQGRPFVGRAGQLLIKTLKKYGIEREEVYIANILKHRPPNNRNPLPNEIEACTPFLRKQLAIIKPKLLLTLGNFASQFILDTKTGITKIRGSIQDSSFGMVMPTLHPSAIIRGAFPVQLFEDDIVKALEFAGFDLSQYNGDK